MDIKLKERLVLLADMYETPVFIIDDPIQIPHRHMSKPDIEISALVTSWIATGNRKAIIKSASRIEREIFQEHPLQYILQQDWKRFAGDKRSFYRYYSFDDFFLICNTLYDVYSLYSSLEEYLDCTFRNQSPLQRLQSVFGQINGMPDIKSSSEAKKMCMFLRWMIRQNSSVDLGIWTKFSPRDLIIPLDTHVHRIAMDLGLTESRKCIKTARFITDALAEIWPDDPVKGDFALFGYGVNEKYS